MSIRSGLDDKYDINVFNSDAWKIAFEYVTKQYVDDNFAGLYSSNLFRGFNYFQNGLTWQSGSLQNDGSILLVDASGNTITINKSKFDNIDASLNDLSLNKASKQDITDAINNLIDGSPQALDTLKEISTALNNDPSFANTIINQLATKADSDYVDESDAILQENINQAQTTLQTNINTVQTNLTNTQTNLQAQITSVNINKAEKNYVDQVDTTLQTQINSINTSKADLTYVNQSDATLQGNINTVQSNLQTQITSLSSLKANDSVVVKLTGNQSISGIKTFTQPIYQNNLLLQGDNTHAYIRPHNQNSTLFLGANNNNVMSISQAGANISGTTNVEFLTAQNSSSFNKGITITETSPNSNISLRSTLNNSQLNFISGANAGNYNSITSDSDSLILYHNGLKDTGSLNIFNWSDGLNGMKFTKQLTKVFNNFEVSNGSFVGSPIFRPTGNSAFGLGNNIFNTTALSSPLIYNGIANGTGNNASYTDFNVSFNSWNGTGFVCTANNTCNAYLDHSNGNFTTKGNFSGKDLYVSGNEFLSGNLSMANSDITSRDITARGLSLTGNINMNTSDVFARSISLSNSLFAANVYPKNLAVSGNAAISGNLSITGNLNMPTSDIVADDIVSKGVNLFEQVQPLNNCKFMNTNVVWQISNNTGVNNILGVTFTVPPRCNNTISGSIPIGLHRAFSFNSTSSTIVTINETIVIQCIILKNGTLFQTLNNIQATRSAIVPTRGNPSLQYSYEMFAGNSVFNFIPDYMNAESSTYELRFTYLGSFTNNSNGTYVAVNSFLRSNTSIQEFTFSQFDSNYFMVVSPNNNYTFAAGNVSSRLLPLKSTITNQVSVVNNPLLVNSTITGFNLVINESCQSNSISSNETNTIDLYAERIFTENARSTNLNVTESISIARNCSIKMNNGLAGYHIDGASNFLPTPVFCSLRSFGRGDTDDLWYVLPGFRIDIYDGSGYSGFLQTFDNTNGPSPQVYNVNTPNRTVSFIVWFLGNQINFPQLS